MHVSRKGKRRITIQFSQKQICISIHVPPAKGTPSNIPNIITQLPTFLYNPDIFSQHHTIPKPAIHHPKRLLRNFSSANPPGFSRALHIPTAKLLSHLPHSSYLPPAFPSKSPHKYLANSIAPPYIPNADFQVRNQFHHNRIPKSLPRQKSPAASG